ncbi:MAG: hypothetical protein Q9225_000996 [Loekoesia sp. 1 TL-2023]
MSQPMERAADRPPPVATSKKSPCSATRCAAQEAKITEPPSTSSVIICQSLAYNNYASPRPRPIDPAVFFDIASIRRSVEEATDLAVRAANGTTIVFLGSSLYSGNGLLGAGGSGNSHTKLSKERKHRMREMASQKLSHAYHLDEIAASVATMQSASSLEEVAKLVLQRNADNIDAKYVDFFHEKIPSRMLAESTSVEPLDEIIHSQPTDAPVLRTRALTKIIKKDLAGAAADLTEALAVARFIATQHRAAQGQVELSNALSGAQGSGFRAWPRESRLIDDNRPSSLEPQLLFHRAGVYLTLACQNAASYLGTPHVPDCLRAESKPIDLKVQAQNDPLSEQSHLCGLEARKYTKSYAKKALRDYISFLAFLDYTPGTAADAAKDYEYHSRTTAPSPRQSAASPQDTPPDTANERVSDDIAFPDTLVQSEGEKTFRPRGPTEATAHSSSPLRKVYSLSDLFAASAPADLPPYPVAPRRMVKLGSVEPATLPDGTGSFLSASGHNEAITYHPLLTESLHSLLLCHCLIQTSSKEHLRHAHMVARLTRICEGYPIFLAARSPSRSDWMEVIRRTDNWIGLEQSWESLCAPVPLIDQSRQIPRGKTQAQARGSRRQEAITESLTDGRVQDVATFQAAVASRERRAEVLKEDLAERNGSGSKRWVQEDSKDYSISTERAIAIARWVKEAPTSIPGSGKSKRRRKLGNMPKGIRAAPIQDADLQGQ